MAWQPPEVGKQAEPTWQPPEVGKGEGVSPKPSRGEQLVSGAKDLFSGLVDWPVQMLLQTGGDIAGAAYAGTHPQAGLTSKDILQNAQHWAEAHDPVPKLIEKGYEHLRGTKSVENPVNKAFETAGNVLERGGQFIQQQTHGVIPAEAFTQFANAVLLKVPELGKKGAMHVASRLMQRRVSDGTEAEIAKAANEYANHAQKPVEPTNEEIQQIKDDLDKRRKAQQQAYDLMQRGASKKEVERALARDKTGALGEEMEKIRQSRAGAAQAFQTQQGEWLPPEEPKGPAGLPPGGPINQTAFRNPRTGEILLSGAQHDEAAKGQTNLEPGFVDQQGNFLPRHEAEARVKEQAPYLLEYKPGKEGLHSTDMGETGVPGARPSGLPTLGEEMSKSPYTTKVLGRLPQGKGLLSREQIENEAKRQDVSKSEQEMWGRVLETFPKGEKIPAQELVGRFKLDTELHQLSPVESQYYADYGLSNIRPNDFQYGKLEEGSPITDASTAIWQSPVDLGKENHFHDPHYFAHTRSFVENDIRHIVEIQSDVAQHVKELSEAKRTELEQALKTNEKRLQQIDSYKSDAVALMRQNIDIKDFLQNRGFRDATDLENSRAQTELRISELKARLGTAGRAKEISPLLKHWYRRIIREELAREARTKMGVPLRFATADTVAKVEGWPRTTTYHPFEGFSEGLEGNRLHGLRRNPLELTGKYKVDSAGRVEAEARQLDVSGKVIGDPEWVHSEFKPADITGKMRGHIASNPLSQEEHQSIYDRYKREIEPYLKSLGGKPYTDPEGHTWIDVPAGKEWRGPVQMYGHVDPKLLAAIGLTLGGAATAAAMVQQDKLEAALVGGATGLALALTPKYIRQVREDWRKAVVPLATTAAVTAATTELDKKHPVEGMLIGLAWGASKLLPKAQIPMIGKMSIDDLVNLRNGAIQAQGRRVSNVVRVLQLAVPDAGRRAELASIIEKGDLSGLSGNELKAAQIFRGYMNSFGEAAKDAGVIKDLLANYVSHVVEREGLPQTKTDEVLQSLFGETRTIGGAGSRPGFAMPRKYATFEDLQKALEGSGLSVKTMDIAEIAGIYGRAMSRAIENKKLVDNLRAARENDAPGASPFIMDAKKAPPSYVSINSPHLRGMLVHPDMEAPLQATLELYRPSAPTRALLSLAMAQKRLATSLSLFHAQNLGIAYMGARGAGVLSTKSAIDAALKLYRDGGEGDAVDTLLKNGLRVDMGRPEEFDPHAMTKLGELLDGFAGKAFGSKFSFLGPTLGTIERAQLETFDRITWDYLHSGMKLAVGLREFEKGLQAHPDWTPEKVAQQVSSYVNDTFGGLDWYRVAAETQSAWGRKMAMALLSPRGRAKLQILAFAPDWTLSTFRAMYKALPGGADVPLTKSLHRKYVLRSALMYFTLMNGINMMASGHPLWDNKKDPFQIEYRDGTTQQMAKHAMEGMEWLRNPTGTARDKLGPVLGESLNQLLGTEYLGGPKMKSRVGHVIQTLSPISISTATEADTPGEIVKRTLESTVGIATHGKTENQRFREKLLKELYGK